MSHPSRRPIPGAIGLVAATVLAATPLTASAAAVDPTAGEPTADAPAEPSGDDAGQAVTFGIGPAAGDGPDARSFLSYGAAPGTSLLDRVVVTNQSARPLDLLVYPADAITVDGGGLDVRERGATDTGLGSWITVAGGSDVTTVTVPAQGPGGSHGEAVLPVEIAVPDDAPPGDHVAGVVASLVSLGENPDSQDIQLEQRVATRVYVRVDGPLSPAVSVEVLDVAYGDADWLPGARPVEVTYRVTNDGNTRLQPQSVVDVRGPFGLGRRTVAGPPVGELVPRGGTTTLTATVEDVPPLVRMSVTVSVDAVDAPGAEDGIEVSANDTGSFWASPWSMTLAVVLLVAVLVAVVAAVLARQRPGRRDPRSPGRDADVTSSASDATVVDMSADPSSVSRRPGGPPRRPDARGGADGSRDADGGGGA